MAATYFIKDFKIVVQSWLMDEKSTMYTVVHSTNFWGQKSRARVFWKRSKSNYSALYYFQIIFWKNHLIIWNDFIWKFSSTWHFSQTHWMYVLHNLCTSPHSPRTIEEFYKTKYTFNFFNLYIHYLYTPFLYISGVTPPRTYISILGGTDPKYVLIWYMAL